MQKVLILMSIVLLGLITSCTGFTEAWVNENPYRTYEIILVNGETETIKARKCRAFEKNKKGNNSPIYEVECSNDGSDWWSTYNGFAIRMKTISE